MNPGPPTFLLQLAPQAPWLLVCLVAICVAFGALDRLRLPALLVAGGAALLLLAALAIVTLQQPAYLENPPAWLPMTIQAIGLLRAMGLGLVIAAAFVKRPELAAPRHTS